MSKEKKPCKTCEKPITVITCYNCEDKFCSTCGNKHKCRSTTGYNKQYIRGDDDEYAYYDMLYNRNHRGYNH